MRTVVRPIIEYASVIWSPYAKDNTSKLEIVQQKAATFVYNDFYSYSSVTAMLNKLSWESLAQRRSKAILTTFYKIQFQLIFDIISTI